ncbi:5-carboxymethyl-2-hydroxymuconate isomerase [Aliiroseovarius sp. KMU-50]|uniref:5-carboxymethyl-2-hydroxymuconate isomerase n=1 Tax=Aliiroseovarius salicola TaxID=3009082 RepID=A0ABT4VWQ1_9RHOB|nr:5-carboxymethyl-2-hydroxymuconate isomerase [Aliiroseovarius sp. KMU-50]MDA5092669.1 5-carboxymethyl-2-hydroxymuconate isomerase [Aliiroseovarius sp. KMU-50]
MPHVRIEHAGTAVDQQKVCEAVFDALAAHKAIPHPESLKVRALPCDAYRIGTEPASFAHAHLTLLPGRSDEVKTELARLILTVMRRHLPEVGSLSVDVADLSSSYVKDVL